MQNTNLMPQMSMTINQDHMPMNPVNVSTNPVTVQTAINPMPNMQHQQSFSVPPTLQKANFSSPIIGFNPQTTANQTCKSPIDNLQPTYPEMNVAPNMQNYNHLSMGNVQRIDDPLRILDLINTTNVWETGGDNFDETAMVTINGSISSLEPGIIQSTLRVIPESDKILQKTRLPFGIAVSPFKDTRVLKTSKSGIIRCGACRTYLNPFVKIERRFKWKCNICFRLNSIPKTRDNYTMEENDEHVLVFLERPELRHSTMQFVAPDSYCHRTFNCSIMAFVFDISKIAKNQRYLEVACRQLSTRISNMDSNLKDNFLITFVLVDEFIHLFKFTIGQPKPKEYIISDIDDPFIPFPSGFAIALDKFETQILDFLDLLPTMFESNSSDSNCLGSALSLVKQLIQVFGGRVTIFQTSLPNVGQGALSARHKKDLTREQLLLVANDYYKEMSLTCTDLLIGFDLFAIGECYKDLSTLACLPKYSNGQLYQYASMGENNFEGDFCRYLNRELGIDGLLKIRFTAGLGIDTFYSNCFVKTPDSVNMPIVSPDSGFAVKMFIEESLDDIDRVAIQVALLYTASNGSRKVRVHTVCLPVSNDPLRIIKSFDIVPAVVLLANMSVDKMNQGNSLEDCRDALFNAATDGLGAYHLLNCNQTKGHLLAPNSGIKLLPIYVFGLLKHLCFDDNRKLKNVDKVVGGCQYLTNYSQELTIFQVCPLLKRIDDVLKTTKGLKDLTLPELMKDRLPLFSASLNTADIYFLDNGLNYYILVNQLACNDVISDFFDVSSFDRIEDLVVYKEIETSKSKLLSEYIKTLNKRREKYNKLIVVKCYDNEVPYCMYKYFIEDKADFKLNYIEFVETIKNRITSN
uniref:Protein transport protein Sec24B n=1 Tax=Rhabditophanes sp. KR3021 TaxID=114890 RepID=A0AC35U0Y0_9BILA